MIKWFMGLFGPAKRRSHVEVRGLHYTIVGANGEVRAHSEQYTRAADARRAAEDIAAEAGWKVVETAAQGSKRLGVLALAFVVVAGVAFAGGRAFVPAHPFALYVYTPWDQAHPGPHPTPPVAPVHKFRVRFTYLLVGEHEYEPYAEVLMQHADGAITYQTCDTNELEFVAQ